MPSSSMLPSCKTTSSAPAAPTRPWSAAPSRARTTASRYRPVRRYARRSTRRCSTSQPTAPTTSSTSSTSRTRTPVEVELPAQARHRCLNLLATTEVGDTGCGASCHRHVSASSGKRGRSRSRDLGDRPVVFTALVCESRRKHSGSSSSRLSTCLPPGRFSVARPA